MSSIVQAAARARAISDTGVKWLPHLLLPLVVSRLGGRVRENCVGRPVDRTCVLMGGTDPPFSNSPNL